MFRRYMPERPGVRTLVKLFRLLGLLLAGAAIGLWAHVAWSWHGKAYVKRDRAVTAPADARLTDAAVDAGPPDSPPFTLFPGQRLPLGTFIEASDGVWFIAPPGFRFHRIDKRSIELDIPNLKIVVAISNGARLQKIKPPKEGIKDFAKNNGYELTSLVDDGATRVVARMKGQDEKGPMEAHLMAQTEPTLRAVIIVVAQDKRMNDPEVERLVDECFHKRLVTE